MQIQASYLILAKLFPKIRSFSKNKKDQQMSRQVKANNIKRYKQITLQNVKSKKKHF